MKQLLIVDDDPFILRSLKRALSSSGYGVECLDRGEEVLSVLGSLDVDLMLLDNRLPDISGLDLLKKLEERGIRIPVVMITAYGTEDTAIEAMKKGAYDYVIKPFDLDEIEEIIRKGIDTYRLMKKEVSFEDAFEEKSGERIIGRSRKMQEVYKIIGQVAETDFTVVIRGESGTGKELVARSIHQHSRRNKMPLLAVNCAAIPEALLESELFGHEKGAFTGASKRRPGKFEQCHGGTLFLDEIGDMPLSIQSKVLRILQNGEFQRVGGHEKIKSDVRVIAATNKPLEEFMRTGQFREDLYYRLDTVTIRLPALREREADIPLLADFFFARFSQKSGGRVRLMDPSVMKKLERYHWPGNVRELANTIQRGLVLAKGEVLTDEHIRFSAEEPGDASPESSGNLDEGMERLLVNCLKTELQSGSLHPYERIMGAVEKAMLRIALETQGGNQVHTARSLGISRNTLRKKMKYYRM